MISRGNNYNQTFTNCKPEVKKFYLLILLTVFKEELTPNQKSLSTNADLNKDIKKLGLSYI